MPPATSSAREQADLLVLFTAITQRDHSVIQRMLFESIAHYAYAGDTPLHLAAASHDPELATQLLAMRANVH